MKKYLLIMTMAVLGLVACSDQFDESRLDTKISLPEDAEFENDAMLVHQWGGEFSLGIATNGEWKIESDRRFLRPDVKAGTGNATVTISVEENTTDERKVGHLTIVFPGHEDLNKTLTVEQEWYGDPVPNGAEEIETSNKIYAVGFSYDCMGEYASPNSVMKEVFNTKEMMKDNVLAVNTVQASLTNNTVTGSSISELTNNLAVKANVKGGFGKFKAEANASFDMNHAENSNHEFASTYFDLAVRHASLSKDLETLKDNYMTDDAWNAINGVPVTNKYGVTKVAYPSTPAGFKSLVEQYGTHVIVEAGLGGRVRFSLDVDISNITTSYDIKAFAKASYTGIVSAEGSVDDKFHQSFKESKKSINTKLDVLGGDEALAKTLGLDGGFTQDNMNKWVMSVTKNNMALVSFSNKSLIPIYELVEKNATVEANGFDGQKRYEMLKDYIDNGCSDDFASYECGTVTKFNTPSFADRQEKGTLVQDVVLGGQWVGQVCEEFIPLIDRDKRVTVVYPVVNNTVRYNMGFFIGDKTHKPARVSWQDDNLSIVEYKDLDFGQADCLYLRGASISAKPVEGTSVLDGEVKDEYMDGLCYNGTENVMFHYPIVKIFNHFWSRTAYGMKVAHGVPDLYGYSSQEYTFSAYRWVDGIMHGYYEMRDVGAHWNVFDLTTPNGWKVPLEADYKALIQKLNDSKISVPGATLLKGGATGFDVTFAGYWDTVYRPVSWRDSQTDMAFATSDSVDPHYPRLINITNTGLVSFGKFQGSCRCVRLMK